MAFDAKCPNCQSEQTQSIQVMSQMNTQTGSANTTTVGYSRGTGIGVAGSATSIAMQSQMAQKYRIPPRPQRSMVVPMIGVLALIAAFIFLMVGIYGERSALVGTVMATGFAALMFWAHTQGKENYLRNVSKWEERRNYLLKAWVCHRCGHDWVPEQE